MWQNLGESIATDIQQEIFYEDDNAKEALQVFEASYGASFNSFCETFSDDAFEGARNSCFESSLHLQHMGFYYAQNLIDLIKENLRNFKE